MILGVDTSCYTTSLALCHEGEILADIRKPLEVKQGERGLRQADGVFMHIKALPELMGKLSKVQDLSRISAVCVSKTPTPAEGSYMPVFMAGYSAASCMASAMSVPLHTTSHQEGHIMAALESCGESIPHDEFISIHISGGTTDIMRTKSTPVGFQLERVATSLDVHAGQLVDRCGVLMGMKFPCGAELDALAMTSEKEEKMPVTLKGADMHLSGAEAYVIRLIESGADPGAVAKGLLSCIGKSLMKSLDVLYKEKPFENVVVGGGVSASALLRGLMKSDKYKILFADKKFSTDNACGVAMIGEKLR